MTNMLTVIRKSLLVKKLMVSDYNIELSRSIVIINKLK